MALRDITNVSTTYVPKVTLDSKYAPLIRRGKLLEDQVCRSTFAAKRAAGDCNIDLWCDGRIYPNDPASGLPSNFRTLKEYFEFLCHGPNGMLGYTERLKSSCGESSLRCEGLEVVAAFESTVADLRMKVAAHENEIWALEVGCRQLCADLEASKNSTVEVTLRRDQLLDEVNLLQSASAELKGKLLQASQELSAQEGQHRRTVDILEAKVIECKEDYRKLQDKLRSLGSTPIGWRQRQSRGLKSLAELSANSGHAKRRRTLLRAQLHPSFVENVQESNKLGGCKKRLHGDVDTQRKTVVALARILSSSEANALVDQPKLDHVGTRMAKKILKQISDSIGPEDILAACDAAGVAHGGYGEIYKSVKGRIALVNPGLKCALLPAPNKIAVLWKQLNANLPQFIGDYYHIDGRMVLAAPKRTKTNVIPKEVILNDKNTLYVDLEVVQRSMVMFYGMTEAGNTLFPLFI
jgi:FtsZ-binding cell division protein ZapB